jgi:hypothetical protein
MLPLSIARRPASISNRIRPAAKMSERSPISRRSHVFGRHVGRRAGVFLHALARHSTRAAMPKSMTRGVLFSSSRTFDGFRSRWMMPWACAWATASRMGRNNGDALTGDKRPALTQKLRQIFARHIFENQIDHRPPRRHQKSARYWVAHLLTVRASSSRLCSAPHQAGLKCTVLMATSRCNCGSKPR